jgi:hypothetical protein
MRSCWPGNARSKMRAREVHAELDLAALVANIGPLLVTASLVSGADVLARARRDGAHGR